MFKNLIHFEHPKILPAQIIPKNILCDYFRNSANEIVDISVLRIYVCRYCNTFCRYGELKDYSVMHGENCLSKPTTIEYHPHTDMHCIYLTDEEVAVLTKLLNRIQ